MVDMKVIAAKYCYIAVDAADPGRAQTVAASKEVLCPHGSLAGVDGTAVMANQVC